MFTIKNIISINGYDEIKGNENKLVFNNVKNINEANEHSLIWINPKRNDKQDIIKSTLAGTIICDSSTELNDELMGKKCFIICKNPKLFFISVLNSLFKEDSELSKHQTSFTSHELRISKLTGIGPFVYIGNASVDDYTVFQGNNFIYDNVVIGKKVIIQAGAVIGSDGFGHVRDDNNILHHFPHKSSVIIFDDVMIGANVTIDRGILSPTIIGEGTKINNLCHIAHNVVIGVNNFVSSNTNINGSVKIGNNNFIGSGVQIRDTISVGDGNFIGMGSCITKNIGSNEVWFGNPAKFIRKR